MLAPLFQPLPHGRLVRWIDEDVVVQRVLLVFNHRRLLVAIKQIVHDDLMLGGHRSAVQRPVGDHLDGEWHARAAHQVVHHAGIVRIAPRQSIRIGVPDDVVVD